jgi:hypothetical protein
MIGLDKLIGGNNRCSQYFQRFSKMISFAFLCGNPIQINGNVLFLH